VVLSVDGDECWRFAIYCQAYNELFIKYESWKYGIMSQVDTSNCSLRSSMSGVNLITTKGYQ
jgi:hypothetical protein